MTKRPDRAVERLGVLLRGGAVALLVVAAVLTVVEPSSSPARAVGASGAGGGMRRDDRFAQRHGAFPGARITPMGVLDANGSPMELGVQNTSATVLEVLDYYERLFAQGGRHVDRNGDDEQGVASYYDEQVGSLVSVQAIRGGQGAAASTMVFTSIVDAPSGVRLAVEPPADLPHPDGLVTVLQIEDPNSARVSNQTITQVARGAPPAVAAFYREQLAARGWRLDSQSAQGEVLFLDLVREGSRLRITVAPLVAEAEESLVTLIREGEESR